MVQEHVVIVSCRTNTDRGIGIGGSMTGGAVYVERWNCVVSLSAAISFSLIWLFWVRSQFDICQALLTFLHELENILKFPHRYKYLNIYTNSHIYTLKCDPQVHDWGNLKRIKMQISFLLLEFPITKRNSHSKACWMQEIWGVHKIQIQTGLRRTVNDFSH